MSASLRFVGFVLILFGLVTGCSRPEREPTSPAESVGSVPPRIAVSSQPLLEMTRAIVGDAATVMLVVPENTSSIAWSPTAADARILQEARLILISGAGYEPWKDRISLPGSRLRDTAAGYYDRFIRIPDAVTHQHGPDGQHSHPGTVWATWLDPDLCVAQLHNVSLNCGRLMPERRQEIEDAESKLSAEINALNVTIVSLKTAVNDESRVVFSDTPHYQYLVERVGLKLHYLHWGAVETFSESDRTEFLDALKDHARLKTGVFLMDSRRSEEAEAFARESGCFVVRIDLCETVSPESVPFPARLKSNLLRLQDGMRRSTDADRNTVFFPEK